MHYIVSLDRNLQCNSVRGRDLRHTPRTRECLQLGPNFECAFPSTAFEVPVALLDAERGLVRACVVGAFPSRKLLAAFRAIDASSRSSFTQTSALGKRSLRHIPCFRTCRVRAA